VCENNGYGEYTAVKDSTAGEIADRARVMEVPTTVIDGMDVWTTRRTALDVITPVRAGEGPTFVEARTYRFVGHSRSDPGKYRPEGELEHWQARDPLLVAERHLRDELGVAEPRVREVAESVDGGVAEVEAA